eukprot:CAMPEP_0185034254 /NCGR_PEP_ID=MMETSP1103-20130426/23953_1 /TAXON_ID=36769 /ORGANISM="Paraphysomonas bandaiensis, Strain Caron Lab Isolate" /LENGTH=312 /DNA_ID=CAMNT_0027570833 /DNA_START=63 /DNA_END=1001 /DNA_ORIENTATION=-
MISIIWEIHVRTYVWQSTQLADIVTPVRRSKCPYDASRNTGSYNDNKDLRIGLLFLYGESLNGEWGSDVMKMVMDNRIKYAKLHGYDIINANSVIDKSRPIAWSKLLAVKKYLPDYDYILYIDMDAVIMEPSVKLENIISMASSKVKQYDFIMTDDWNGLNTGVFFVRRSEWSLAFLQLAWDQWQLIPPRSTAPGNEKHPFEYEQRAFHYLLNTPMWKSRPKLPTYKGEGVVVQGKGSGGSRGMRTHFLSLPQCTMNSYALHPFDYAHSQHREFSQYVDGDFIIHFAGKKGSAKMAILKHYLELAEKKFSQI